jgi:IclR family transcriptional regulator, KDG regulon repressor
LLAYNPSMIKPTISKGLLRRAPNTITCVEKLKLELAAIKANGYAISNNENEMGLYGIAAPIKSYNGQIIAALNMVGPVSYMLGQDTPSMIHHVVKTAESISKELGYISVL